MVISSLQNQKYLEEINYKIEERELENIDIVNGIWWHFRNPWIDIGRLFARSINGH